MLVVGVVVFALVHLTPGDPAAVILGDRATPEDIERLRDQLGLNDPLPVQFVRLVRRRAAARFRRVDLPRRAGHPGALLDRVQPTAAADALRAHHPDADRHPGRGARGGAPQLAARPRADGDRHLRLRPSRPSSSASCSSSSSPCGCAGCPPAATCRSTEDPVAHFKAMLLPAFALGFSVGGAAGAAGPLLDARRAARGLRADRLRQGLAGAAGRSSATRCATRSSRR